MKWFKRKKKETADNLSAATLEMEKALLVSDYLSVHRIHFFNQGTAKQQIFAQLVKSLPYSNSALAMDKISEREKAGSTVIGSGIAVPHARLVDIPDIMAAMAICPADIENISGEEPVRIFILFLGPANYMKRNLDFLAGISALFLAEGFCDSVLRLTTSEDVLAKIREAEKR